MHKCDTCQYKGEHQVMGFKPSGVCTKEHDLLKAMHAYRASECPFVVKEEKKEETPREKLVNLINEACEGHVENLMQPYGTETLADILIAHGVTVKEPQKPLTVEEASGTNEPVWMEYITGRVFVCDLVASPVRNGIYDSYIIGDTEPKPLPEMYYGKAWRCWAEKPTEEERRAAEWL